MLTQALTSLGAYSLIVEVLDDLCIAIRQRLSSVRRLSFSRLAFPRGYCGII